MHNIVAYNELQQHADRLGELARDTATGLWEMGKILADAQDKLAAYGSGSFQRWVEDRTALSTRTAYRLINVYRAFDCAKLAQTTFATSALYLLAEPTTPPEARAQAIREAERGEPITPARAQQIVQAHQPPPRPPEYREFERERLMPRFTDAGLPDAPQIVSAEREEPPLATEDEAERAEASLRASIVEVLDACKQGRDVEACADELLEIMGQCSGSITLAAHFGIALGKGPLSLLDLTQIACRVQGVNYTTLEREEYLMIRKRVLRLLDSLTFTGLGLFEHVLENKQLVYGLLSCEEDNT